MQKKMSKKRLAFILVAVCLVGLIGIGISYSYYLANISTSNEENKNSNITTTTITKVVMDMQGKVTSDGAYPGHKMAKEVVVRGIGESNSLPANASIKIIPDLGDFSSDVTWKLYKSEEVITCSTVEHTDSGKYYEDATCNIPSSATLELEGTSGFSYKNIVVKPNTETKYYLVVEYHNSEDYDQSNQMGKSFNIDIGIGDYLTVVDGIIAQVDTTGKCPTVNTDGTVDTSSSDVSSGYLCTAPDAYGTSYYYRGNVTNNYVKFGKWADDAPDVVYGYYSETSNWYTEYDSMEACQNASSDNTNCTIINRAGKDMYWRIIRINGDNSVRVIYDGTSAHANGESGTDRQIGTSTFNRYWKKDNVQEATNSLVYYDNAGVGYMYGNRDAIVESAGYYKLQNYLNTRNYYIAKDYNYDAATDKFTLKDPISVLGSNITSDYVGYYTMQSYEKDSSYSYVYKILDVTTGSTKASVKVGYVKFGTSSKEIAQTNTNSSDIKNYLDNWYENNIKSMSAEQYLIDNIFCNDRSFYYYNPGTGAGNDYTKYNWYVWHPSQTNLKCQQQNDAFSVGEIIHGNGKLIYPIGLITTDEVVLAGGGVNTNDGYYLYSGTQYWTSTPAGFDDNIANIRNVGSDGVAALLKYAYNESGVRPVLNLSQEVLQNGDGTMENPYHLSGN